jgi:hypothetical protein
MKWLPIEDRDKPMQRPLQVDPFEKAKVYLTKQLLTKRFLNKYIKSIHVKKHLSLPSATKGVIAVEKPTPNDMATKKKLFPKETAASSAVPN